MYRVPSSVREFLEDLRREWPEVYELAARLRRGEGLSDADREWVKELSEASGWDREDVVEDLVNLERDPSERVERYRQLFEKYFSEALKYKESNDLLQAAEKIWGAVTALIKLYAAIKHVAVAQWSRGKLDTFVTSNVEKQYKELFRNLLDRGSRFHEYFYEKNMDEQTFEERWRELIALLNKAKDIVYR